jgi:DNA-directed RNA polymerase-5 subunit 1
MKMVAKGILKDHQILVADSMMNTGIKKRFNNVGYKATFRPLKVQVPLIESTLFTPMKCIRRLQRDAILIHWDVWSHHVHGASMQYLALSHLLRFCNENQLKSNKEFDDDLFDFLALVRTDQEKARYTFLDDVDYLVDDNAMGDHQNWMEPLVCPLLNIVEIIKTSEKDNSGKMTQQRMQAGNKMQVPKEASRIPPRGILF